MRKHREEMREFIKMVTPTDVIAAMGITSEEHALIEEYSDALLELGCRAAERVVQKPSRAYVTQDAVRDFVKRAVSARNRYMRRAWPILRQYPVAVSVSPNE